MSSFTSNDLQNIYIKNLVFGHSLRSLWQEYGKLTYQGFRKKIRDYKPSPQYVVRKLQIIGIADSELKAITELPDFHQKMINFSVHGKDKKQPIIINF